MKIMSVGLQRFGQFTEHPPLEFGPGLNLVVGPNEAGKTTLVDAILMLLFGVTKKESLYKRYRPLAGDEYAANMVVQTSDGQVWRINRDFEQGRLHLELKTADGWTEAGRRSDNPILADLGLNSLNLCRSTILISRSDVVWQGLEQKYLGQAITAQVTGGKTEIAAQKAQRELEQRRRQLQSEVQGLTRRRDELSQRCQTLRQAYQDKLKLEEELRTAEAELAEASSISTRYGPLVEDYKQHQEASRNLEKARQQLNETLRTARTIREREEELAAARQKLEETAQIIRNRLAEVELQLGEYDLETMSRERLARLKDVQRGREEAGVKIAELQGSQKRYQKRGRLNWGLFVLGVWLGCAPLLGEPWVITISLGLLGTALAVYELVRLWQRRQENRKNRTELSRAAAGLEFYEAELQQITGGMTPEEFSQQVERLAGLRTEHDQLMQQLAVQEAGQPRAGSQEGSAVEIKQLIDSQALEMAKWESVCFELNDRIRWLDQDQAADWAARLAEIDLSGLQQRVQGCRVRLRQHEVSARPDELWDYETELTLVEQQLADLARRVKALRIADNIMGQCISEVQNSLVPQIEERAGAIFTRVTGGRYTQIFLEPTSEQLAVWVRTAAGERLSAELHLSSGAAAQLYIALRIALAEVLLPNRDFPIILDDPLITFDSRRSEPVLGLIKALACTHQTILVTKDAALADQLAGTAQVATI